MSPDASTAQPPAPPGFVPPIAPNSPLGPPVLSAPVGYTRSRRHLIPPARCCLVAGDLAGRHRDLHVRCVGWDVPRRLPGLFAGAVERDVRFAEPEPAPDRKNANARQLDPVLQLGLGTDGAYLLVLLFSTALASADRGFHSLDPRKIPPLAGIWKWRKLAILVFAASAFALAFTQVLHGFGLERAVHTAVSEQFAKERADTKGDRTKLALVQYREEQEYAKYSLERTTWLYVGLTCNLLAVFAMLMHTALDRRGDKPPPRLVLQY